jgi:hypothetical protein
MSQAKNKHTVRKKAGVPAWLVLLGLVVAGMAALFAWSFIDNNNKLGARTVPVEVKGSAKFVAEPAQIDLGDVKLGQTVEVSFKVGNAGDQPLQFTQVPIIQVVEGC